MDGALTTPARSGSPSSPPAGDAEAVSLKTWITVFGAVLGAFMAVLNIQVTNASLPDIQGGIGTGLENGGWISTAYLIGEIITIPLTGWLSEVFSVRRYMIGNTILFLIFSAACGLTETFPQMVALRAVQGFTGGILIPMAFTCIIRLLPLSRRPMGLAMFALSATFAPAIGPTIGGFITDSYGWRYIFFLNLVPGIPMLAALAYGLKREPMQLRKFAEGDFLGVSTMAIGLACLQTVLEDGNKDDWFGSVLITRLSIIAAIALCAFIIVELRVARPLINLRLFRRRNFAFAGIANVMLGFVLYGSVYLLPIYLAESQGYDAEQAGNVMAWVGLPQLLILPLIPRVMKHIDARLLVIIGFAIFAVSSFINMNLDANYSGPQMIWPNIIRAFGQAMVMTPLSVIATAGIEPANASSASSLFNMMRNLGGAFGIAVLQTFITKREQFHSAVITPAVSMLAPATTQRISMMAQFFEAHGLSDKQAARHEAIIAIGRSIRAQAYLMAYGDAFALLGTALVIAIIASLFLARAKVAGAGGAH